MPTDSSHSGSGRMPIIDFHAHPSIPLYKGLMAQVDELGPADRFAYDNFSPSDTPVWSAGTALEMMEREGIVTQVLSLPDATLVLRGDFARGWARRINEAMAGIVAAHPGRFGAFAVLPYDDVDSTLAEIAYALDVLKLDGVCTATNIRGVYLGDAAFDPWMEELHRRRATLFVHPARPVSAYLPAPNYLELSFDTTRMLTNMIRTGAKRRFDAINIVATHAGGTMPFLSHRFRTLEPIIGKLGVTAEDIRSGLASFHYDLNSCLDRSVVGTTLDMVPASRLLLGFDYPYLPAELAGQELARFFAIEDLTPEQRHDIAAGTALRLLSPDVAARSGELRASALAGSRAPL